MHLKKYQTHHNYKLSSTSPNITKRCSNLDQTFHISIAFIRHHGVIRHRLRQELSYFQRCSLSLDAVSWLWVYFSQAMKFFCKSTLSTHGQNCMLGMDAQDFYFLFDKPTIATVNFYSTLKFFGSRKVMITSSVRAIHTSV